MVISKCIKNIKDEINKDKNPILIGSSLGGFLAAKIALKNLNIKNIILFNPAIIPKDYDIKKIKDMPQRIVKDMVEPRFFTKKIPAKINIFCGTEDKVVPNNWVINFAQSQEAEIKFLQDDHSLSKNVQKIPEYIEKILITKN